MARAELRHILRRETSRSAGVLMSSWWLARQTSVSRVAEGWNSRLRRKAPNKKISTGQSIAYESVQKGKAENKQGTTWQQEDSPSWTTLETGSKKNKKWDESWDETLVKCGSFLNSKNLEGRTVPRALTNSQASLSLSTVEHPWSPQRKREGWESKWPMLDVVLLFDKRVLKGASLVRETQTTSSRSLTQRRKSWSGSS